MAKDKPNFDPETERYIALDAALHAAGMQQKLGWNNETLIHDPVTVKSFGDHDGVIEAWLKRGEGSVSAIVALYSRNFSEAALLAQLDREEAEESN